MNDVCRLLKIMKQMKDEIFAMATIIQVDGSAYRREGAKMLIGNDGSYFGTISAGCLEQDLIHKAQEVINSLQSTTVTYDLRSVDDLSWGQGAGCDGCIHVYIEPIGWELNKLDQTTPLWPYVEKLLDQRMDLVTIKGVKGGCNDNILLFTRAGDCLPAYVDKIMQQRLAPYVQSFYESGAKAKLLHVNELNGDFFFEKYHPKDELYIFGAGPDAEPLVKLASQVDFSVVVIDPRSSRCNESLFPCADFLFIEHPESFLEKKQIPVDSFVIVMTHNFTWDQKILERLVTSPPKYLGVLGPKRRTERLLSFKPVPAYIRSPIGLSIGAEGPEEISISVISELIKERNGYHLQNKLQKQIVNCLL